MTLEILRIYNRLYKPEVDVLSWMSSRVRSTRPYDVSWDGGALKSTRSGFTTTKLTYHISKDLASSSVFISSNLQPYVQTLSHDEPTSTTRS